MSGALRRGLHLALTIGLLMASLRPAVSLAAAQSVAARARVVVLVSWSEWARQLRTWAADHRAQHHLSEGATRALPAGRITEVAQ